MELDAALRLLDWLGVAVFAASGALVASRKQMDAVGFVLIGIITGIGVVPDVPEQARAVPPQVKPQAIGAAPYLRSGYSRAGRAR